MEKRTFTKSSPEEVEEMRKLYRMGLSLNEIGRRFKKNHSTIGYWVKNYKQKGEKDLVRQPVSQVPLVAEEQTEIPKPCPPEIIEKKIIEQIKGFCQVCKKKIKDPKWMKTNHCSRDCWDKATDKRTNRNWWVSGDPRYRLRLRPRSYH